MPHNAYISLVCIYVSIYITPFTEINKQLLIIYTNHKSIYDIVCLNSLINIILYQKFIKSSQKESFKES